jgi:hypothetical protein
MIVKKREEQQTKTKNEEKKNEAPGKHKVQKNKWMYTLKTRISGHGQRQRQNVRSRSKEANKRTDVNKYQNFQKRSINKRKSQNIKGITQNRSGS